MEDGGLKRVVIVEDHAAFAKALKLVLEGTAGVMVVASVGTVREGVDLAENGGGFDLAVVDLMRPDGNGTEVVRALKRSRPGTPVGVLSANEDLSGALEAGADEAISKRMPLPQIVASLKRLLEAGCAP
jgi:DNA-binding NarL/FixJ family response regulator